LVSALNHRLSLEWIKTQYCVTIDKHGIVFNWVCKVFVEIRPTVENAA